MKLAGRSIAPIAAVCALAAILVVLAFLQVHWIDRVARAEQDRMEVTLHTAVARLSLDFYNQLLHICSAFKVSPRGVTGKALQSYAERYDDWMYASTRPRLVSSLYVWKAANPAGRRLFRLNPVTEKFEAASWPAGFVALRAHFHHHPSTFFRRLSPDEPRRRWYLVEDVPAVVHPLWSGNALGGLARGAKVQPAGYVVIQLDMRFMQDTLFPLLMGRYFHSHRGSVYRVSIVSEQHPGEVLYQSLPPASEKPAYPPDELADLIPSRPMTLLQPPLSAGVEERQAETEARNLTASREEQEAENGVGPIIFLAGKPDWQIVVRHRSGSVHAAVLDLQWRDLGVSLGVLAILAVSTGLIVVSAQRAQRLAKMQLDFAAGISHELRTPLAVICSAAENLADGVVELGSQVRNYGALIKSEGRRLSEMVEQTLGFAAQQGDRQSWNRHSVEVAKLIDAALRQAEPVIKEAGVTVDTQIEPGLQPVLVDEPALLRCLQNLIVNAVKYSGENRWAGITARSTHTRRKPEIEITVRDRGIGIDASDLTHIFKPFYRGKSMEVHRIHGTGLGLSLAKDIAEAMGGSLSAKSTRGRGTVFTLRLPASAPGESFKLAADAPPGLDIFEAAKK